ncbi:MAG: FMN-binding protein [Dehalococcoidales bacterium]|nr:FMN-binding protein [Dehalococcoidales bacterium]
MPAKKSSTLKNAFPIILLTIVVTVCVSILTFVDSLTRDKISAQEDEAVKALLSEMFPGMSHFEYQDEIYTIYADGDQIGYAFLAVGNGYGGDINILVGLEDETTIKGITIASQSETPGLGTRIAEPAFTDQFAGLAISDVSLSRDGGQIDAITSSTISSSAVVEAVSQTAMEKVKQLKENQ